MTFILRLSVDGAGRTSGVVERVRNGEKGRFYGIEELSPLIAQMMRGETQSREETDHVQS
ncbi:MAG: hypothetical protein HYU41_10775 [Candidatus Rokubacteria bacterium]|nr:hypothetical protein [Candidatus Rokubacteria bacterium]